MKYIKNLILLFLIILLCFAESTTSQEKITIAVYDLSGDDISASALSVLSNIMRQELMKTNKFTVVDRNQMEQIFKEFDYQQSGCTGVECLVEVGQMLNAEKIIGGTIGKLGKKYIINIQVVDVESSEMEKLETENYVGPIEDLDIAIRSVTNKLFGEEIAGTDKSIIYVSSAPQGAKVYVNSVFKGNSPLKIPVELEEYYQINVRLIGYTDWQQTVQVKSEEPIIINAMLAEIKDGAANVGGSQNINEIYEWEIMDISREKWVELKKAHIIYS